MCVSVCVRVCACTCACVVRDFVRGAQAEICGVFVAVLNHDLYACMCACVCVYTYVCVRVYVRVSCVNLFAVRKLKFAAYLRQY